MLKTQIAAEEIRMKSEQARLSAAIDGLETEINELQAQIGTQNEQIRLSNDIVSSVTGLKAKGYMSEIEYRRRELAALEQKQKLNALKQQLASRQNQLTETHYSLEQLPTVTAGKIQNLRSELATTEERMTEIGGRRAYEIRAPTSGHISTLQATIGQFEILDDRKWKLFRRIARLSLSCSFPPERSVSCVPDKRSELCMRHFRTSNLVPMPVA